jgi:hypothetical protein
MSKERTKEINDPRSCEERVFARFDTVDQRFDRMEIRITSLEDKRYDTKPIWERALAEISETNRAIQEFRSEVQLNMDSLRSDLRGEFQTGIEGLRTDMRSEFQTGIEGLRTDMRSEFQTGIEGLRNEMKSEFAAFRHEMKHELRGVTRKIEVLNDNILEMQADQKYVDRRLEELETQTKSK